MIQTVKTPVPGPRSDYHTLLSSDALCIEVLADKYDMPTVALVVLEELQRQLTLGPSIQQQSAASTWHIAERAVHWRNTGVLDTCLELIAKPLLLSGKGGGYMDLPPITNPLFSQNQGAVRSVIRAVNKAIGQKAGQALSSIPAQFL